MDFEIKTSTEIQRSRECVWGILSAPTEYPKWNPLFAGIEGELSRGEDVVVLTHRPGRSPWKMRVKMHTLHAPQRMSWTTKIPFVLGSEHYFELQAVGNDACTIVHGERFTGPASLLARVFQSRLQQHYQEYCDALREFAMTSGAV